MLINFHRIYTMWFRLRFGCVWFALKEFAIFHLFSFRLDGWILFRTIIAIAEISISGVIITQSLWGFHSVFTISITKCRCRGMRVCNCMIALKFGKGPCNGAAETHYLLWRVRWSWSWWRHQMETFSALLAICAGNSPVIGEFPAQRPVTRSFDVLFDLRLTQTVE